MGDHKTFVAGYADLGGTHIRCYNNSASYWKQDYGEKRYVECSAKYYCIRNSRQIRRTIVTTSSTMQSVPFLGKQNHDATDDLGVQEQIKGAFLGLKTHYKSNAADGEGFQLGSKNYKMAYAVNRMEKEGDPYYETDRINQVADLTAEKMLPELWTKDKMSGNFPLTNFAWKKESKINKSP